MLTSLRKKAAFPVAVCPLMKAWPADLVQVARPGASITLLSVEWQSEASATPLQELPRDQPLGGTLSLTSLASLECMLGVRKVGDAAGMVTGCGEAAMAAAASAAAPGSTGRR